MTKGPATCTEFSLTPRQHATAAPLYKERAAAAGLTACDLEFEVIGMEAVSRHSIPFCYGMILGSLLRLPVPGGHTDPYGVGFINCDRAVMSEIGEWCCGAAWSKWSRTWMGN